MRTRVLGASEIEVSALGLGCMGMSEFYGVSDDVESLKTLEHALEKGVTFYDTADTYGIGHNEELLGKFVQGKSDRIVIATKCGIVRERGKYERRLDSSPAYVKSACEASLKRLGVDCIDLFYLHRLSPEVPIEDSVGALKELVSEGKIKAYGLCEVSEKTLRRAHAEHPVTALQTEYSLWSRDPEKGILDVCREQNTAFVPYSPLGRGFLTGTMSNPDKLEDGDFRKANPRFQGENLERNNKLLEAVQKVAADHSCSLGQVALAWLLAQGDDIIPIPGTRRKKYIDDNVGADAVRLTPEALDFLDKTFTPDAVSGGRYTAEGMKGIDA
ncbi:aldo/keto reductase [Roseovarius sp.]|uniref:aldo/keto reductase n=1 Tax=Roseovarius sp. TaxID=1486281 RepID=UPI003A97C2C9